ncbi:AMP-activated protein kinase beta subunit [Rhodotorula toruloides]|uniref:AMP-activated protein kinase beta subunit n=1 Tax=Rhodotorula toruloides TaxID=5286 RepID=A0A511KSA1_RHOTO|nr:AMP-activated protein kinase beta subunit [Rhodotorula toruloides]
MGNNASTPSTPSVGGAPGSALDRGGSRSSRNSPRSRSIPLPGGGEERFHGTTSRTPSKRKKRIELPDVSGGSSSGQPSRSSSISHHTQPAPSTLSQPSPPPARHPRAGSGSGVRRKHSDRVPVVDEGDLDPEILNEGVGGSLRGALQGKAEHVVYGPRRTDDPSVLLSSPPAAAALLDASPGSPVSGFSGATVRPVAIGIPGTGSASIARTPAGAAAGVGRDGSLTHAGMGAIGANALLMDPDDTTHPGFGTSARLTSDVIMSTDRMPVLNSPTREGVPDDSPFGEGAQTPAESMEGAEEPRRAEGSQTPGQERRDLRPSSASLADGAGSGSAGSSTSSRTAGGGEGVRRVTTPQTSFAGAVSSILAPTPAGGEPKISSPPHPSAALLPPTTSSPTPPSAAPTDTVQAPPVPDYALPIASASIPSGTSVIASPATSRGTTPTGAVPSPAVLLPPAVFNAPVAAIPIPLLSVPSQTIAQNLLAAAVDLGAGERGVPTLIKWKDEDGQEKGREGRGAKGPKEVYVTGTFANGWKTKIELRKTDASDFSALISLPPGPHRLKFIVDNEWKASKHLPVATDADGNLINYLQVNPVNSKIPETVWSPPPTTPAANPQPLAVPNAQTAAAVASIPPSSTPNTVARALGGFNPPFWPFAGAEDDDTAVAGAGQAYDADEDDTQWTQEIPSELIQWGEWEADRDAIEAEWYVRYPNPTHDTPQPQFPPPPPSAGVQPPSLPAQLEKGPLNHAAYVTQGSGDDNSILPKPDHSVINHLAASPIKGGYLSVGVTTRYKRKFVTIVYYKALSSR